MHFFHFNITRIVILINICFIFEGDYESLDNKNFGIECFIKWECWKFYTDFGNIVR
jgi:hypothetical protein